MAPKNDLDLIKRNCTIYHKHDKEISSEILKTFSRHQWYLNERNIGFAFFDARLGY